jgi:hemin uptake protein HemP
MTTKLNSKEKGSFDVLKVDDSAAELNSGGVTSAKKLSSSKLFEASKEVMIEHDNDIYILRLTRQNKLILTK